jgi:farnesyl diphosphate synthase
MDRYKWIVKYKTAFYSFYLPVALGMYMAGSANEKSLKVASDILLPLGEYFQVQDDYLDCYGDPHVIGKIGTDIEDNKCGWLINQALLICSPEQRKELAANYARKDPACVAKVKNIYNDLQLPQLFAEYEEQSHKELSALIEKVDPTLIPHEVFTTFMKRIYKRTK